MFIKENKICVLTKSFSNETDRSHILAPIKNKIGFSDDIVWPAIDVTQALIEKCQNKNIYLDSLTTAVIVYGDTRPFKSETKVSTQLAKVGRVSPLTFAAASAATIASAICTGFEFRGPSLNFHDANYITTDIVETIILSWISSKVAQHVACLQVEQKEGNIAISGAIWK